MRAIEMKVIVVVTEEWHFNHARNDAEIGRAYLTLRSLVRFVRFV